MARKLGLNLDSLFPGKNIPLGTGSVEIKPLSIVTLVSVIRKVKAIGPILLEKGVTWENYNDPQNLFTIVEVIMENVPQLMEELTDIDIEDVKQLPLEALVSLLTGVIDVNIQSKESLEKNFESLAGKLGMGMEKTQKKELQK